VPRPPDEASSQTFEQIPFLPLFEVGSHAFPSHADALQLRAQRQATIFSVAFFALKRAFADQVQLQKLRTDHGVENAATIATMDLHQKRCPKLNPTCKG